MRDTQAVIERTQQVLANARAFRERCEADRQELRNRIDQALIKRGQLSFVFPAQKPAGRSH